MRRMMIVLTLLTVFLMLSSISAMAMTSTHYGLTWFTPVSSGGGPVSSAHYRANFTVGQTAIGTTDSTNYDLGLGFWYGVNWLHLFLPLIFK
jgi:hypothetical protein